MGVPPQPLVSPGLVPRGAWSSGCSPPAGPKLVLASSAAFLLDTEPVAGGPRAPSPVPAWQVPVTKGPPCSVPSPGALVGLEVAQGALACITLLRPLQGHCAARGAPSQPAGPEQPRAGGLWAVRPLRWSFAAPRAGWGGGRLWRGLTSLSEACASPQSPGCEPVPRRHWGDQEEGRCVEFSALFLQGSELPGPREQGVLLSGMCF